MKFRYRIGSVRDADDREDHVDIDEDGEQVCLIEIVDKPMPGSYSTLQSMHWRSVFCVLGNVQ